MKILRIEIQNVLKLITYVYVILYFKMQLVWSTQKVKNNFSFLLNMKNITQQILEVILHNLMLYTSIYIKCDFCKKKIK